MRDRARREVERLAAIGDCDARAALLRAKLREGAPSDWGLQLAAFTGDATARAVLAWVGPNLADTALLDVASIAMGICGRWGLLGASVDVAHAIASYRCTELFHDVFEMLDRIEVVERRLAEPGEPGRLECEGALPGCAFTHQILRAGAAKKNSGVVSALRLMFGVIGPSTIGDAKVREVIGRSLRAHAWAAVDYWNKVHAGEIPLYQRWV